MRSFQKFRIKIAYLILLFFFGHGLLSATESVYNSISYTQRGVLSYDDVQIPVSAKVVFKSDKYFLLLESTLGTLVKISLDKDGVLLTLETGANFSEDWAKRYVLRDFKNMVCLDVGNSDYQILYDAQDRILKVYKEGYSLDFSNYSHIKAFNKTLPKSVFIKTEQYNIKLYLLED